MVVRPSHKRAKSKLINALCVKKIYIWDFEEDISETCEKGGDKLFFTIEIRHIYFWKGGDSYLHIYTVNFLQMRRFKFFGDSVGRWRNWPA